MRAHASVSTPKRSLPNPFIRVGMEKAATIIGVPLPIRFQMVLRANRPPPVRCRFSFVSFSAICLSAEPTSICVRLQFLPAFLNPFLFKPEMPHEDYGTCRVISGADPQPPPSPTRQLLTPSIALDHPKMPRATGFIFYHL